MPKEGFGSPRGGFTGGCELPDMNTGTEFKSSARAIHALNC